MPAECLFAPPWLNAYAVPSLVDATLDAPEPYEVYITKLALSVGRCKSPRALLGSRLVAESNSNL